MTRLQFVWGMELGELNGITRRTQQEKLKAFLSRRVDLVRRKYAPGTGFALLVIAFCLLLQTIPSAICVLTPRAGWDPPLSPERVRYCKGG